jgi:hypothetical protein
MPDNVLPKKKYSLQSILISCRKYRYLDREYKWYDLFRLLDPCMPALPGKQSFPSIRFPIWEGAYIGKVQFAVYYIHIAPRKPLV